MLSSQLGDKIFAIRQPAEPPQHSIDFRFRSSWRMESEENGTSIAQPGKSFRSKAGIWGKGRKPPLEDQRGPLGLSAIHKPVDEAVADIVFVHGLNGGSRKTWTHNPEDPALSWPHKWLSRDPDFRDVRIHTFGYDSDWTKGSVLDILDFAQSLLEWVISSPEIPSDEEKPMILVCHSMGGLVAKKAYVLSRQHEKYQRFASLVQYIFFLATPHRGADLAEVLSKILRIYTSARPFVGDLHPTSKFIQSINEEFPRYSDELKLFSFYETLPMVFGLKKSLVVPKESATLQYPNERVLYLDADHRGVCKFESPGAHNYRVVRNELAAAVNSVRMNVRLRRKIDTVEQQRCVDDCLGISEPPEDDYLRVEPLKLPGSCEWIGTRVSFRQWQETGCPGIYWLNAKPGAGKSVLCGHVLNSLRNTRCDVSFFFFAHGDTLKSSLSTFLRSMAWQMASKNIDMFEHLAGLCKREPQMGQADYRTIWRKLFVECALKYQPQRPQYWVIDALDECKADKDLVPYLVRAASTGFIRIFLTSRTLYHSYGLHTDAMVTVHVDAVSEATTNIDIQLYVEAHARNIPVHDRAFVAKFLLDKSSGCFLWVKLVLPELRRGLTRKGIMETLEEIPSDMDGFYERVIQDVSQRATGAETVVAILYWTACATRTLTIAELYQGLRVDLNDEIDGNLQHFVEASCGQLVNVDSNHKVRLIHLTAREFLFSKKNTAFRLNREVGNKRLAMACLEYLSGPELAPSTSSRLVVKKGSAERMVFLSYASNALFTHISFANAEDDKLSSALGRFLRSPKVLTWIEHISRHSELSRLVHAGNTLKKYAAKRLKDVSPPGYVSQDDALFEKWATDLVRLVTKFGLHLRQSPGSIYNLVAPFCPRESAMRQQFASSSRAIQVGGTSLAMWDDCAFTVLFQERTAALDCGPGLFAVGLKSGDVVVFDEVTCQEIKKLEHGESVQELLFGLVQPVLVSAGLSTIKIWRRDNWKIHHNLRLESHIMSLALTDEDRLLLATCVSNKVYVWETQTGAEQQRMSWLEDSEEGYSSHFQSPLTTSIAGTQALLAVSYRGQNIILWDIEKGATYEINSRTGSLDATAGLERGYVYAHSMIFSRASDVQLLVAAYNDGVLRLFNVEEGVLQAETVANAHELASSADGLTLACGSSDGEIQLLELETLKLLYRIRTDQWRVQQLAFSFDSHRLLNIQAKHCRVWDPPVLVRGNLDDENTDTIPMTANTLDVVDSEITHLAAITSVAVAEPGHYAFCGKSDGIVYMYDTSLEKLETEFVRHSKNSAILHVELNALATIIISVDTASRVLVNKLHSDPHTGFTLGTCLLDWLAGAAVYQVCINTNGDRILISTSREHILWDTEKDRPQEIARLEFTFRRNWRWSTHPLRSDHLVLISESKAHLFHWQSFVRLSKFEGIELAGAAHSDLIIKAANKCFDSQYLSTSFAESFDYHARSQIFLWNAVDLDPEADIVQPVSQFQPLADRVQHVIGAYGHRVVFLHQNGWICSANASNFDTEHHDRHFFIPEDWLSTVRMLRMRVLHDGTILFVKVHELVSIRNGLNYRESGRNGLRKQTGSAKDSASQNTLGELSTTMHGTRLNP